MSLLLGFVVWYLIQINVNPAAEARRKESSSEYGKK